MRFALTDDQVALRDTVREVLADTCPPSVVRGAWSGGSVDRVSSALVELGIPGMAVPEKDGGLGLSDVDLVPVLIELGYAAVPLPVAETAAVVAPLLAAAAASGVEINDALSSAGSVPETTLDRASFMRNPGGPWVAVRRAAGPVPWAGRSSVVLDLTGSVALVRPAHGTDVSTVDGSRAARVLDDAPGAVVTDDPELVALARDRADLTTAAQLLGLGRRMLDLTVDHVRTRTQFGVPVGSFQAVKHHLADALLQLEFAEPVVYAAAWAVATGSADRARDVSAATVLATDAARLVARKAVQCHGAIGYTVEYDLHLYAKRAWALAATCDLDAHLSRLARALDLEEAP